MLARLCNGCGYTFLPQELKRGRCRNCERKRNRERTLHEPSHRAYSSPEWRNVRQVVYARDHGRCRYESGKCRGRLEAHHIVPAKADSDLFFDLSNLELVCRAHHEMREHGTGAAFLEAHASQPPPRFRETNCLKGTKLGQRGS